MRRQTGQERSSGPHYTGVATLVNMETGQNLPEGFPCELREPLRWTAKSLHGWITEDRYNRREGGFWSRLGNILDPNPPKNKEPNPAPNPRPSAIPNAVPNAAAVVLPRGQEGRDSPSTEYFGGSARSSEEGPNKHAELLAVGNAVGEQNDKKKTSDKQYEQIQKVFERIVDQTRPGLMGSVIPYCKSKTRPFEPITPCSKMLERLLPRGYFFSLVGHNKDVPNGEKNKDWARQIIDQVTAYDTHKVLNAIPRYFPFSSTPGGSVVASSGSRIASSSGGYGLLAAKPAANLTAGGSSMASSSGSSSLGGSTAKPAPKPSARSGRTDSRQSSGSGGDWTTVDRKGKGKKQ